MVWKLCPSRCVFEMSRCVFETVCHSVFFPVLVFWRRSPCPCVKVCFEKGEDLLKGKIKYFNNDQRNYRKKQLSRI